MMSCGVTTHVSSYKTFEKLFERGGYFHPPLGCCYRVKVAFTKGRSNGAYKLHPYAFGYYKLEPGSVKGHPHYTSEDGRFALAYCGDSWWVQLASNRGECRGWFHSGWQGNR